MALKQITVRGVGVELHKLIKAEANRRGLSVNRYVLHVLREAVGLGDGQYNNDLEFHDLDHLAGTWTSDENELFERQLVSQRKVDAELWQ